MREYIELTILCPFCGDEHTVMVGLEDYFLYKDGELAQNAFPYLSATEREQLISHMCPECQKKYFADNFYEDEVE